MATFRIGDKARLVNCATAKNPDWRELDGDVVTILGLPGKFSNYPTAYEITKPPRIRDYAICYSAPREFLAPLTDHGADAFIERIKKLGREPINTPEKVVS